MWSSCGQPPPLPLPPATGGAHTVITRSSDVALRVLSMPSALAAMTGTYLVSRQYRVVLQNGASDSSPN